MGEDQTKAFRLRTNSSSAVTVVVVSFKESEKKRITIFTKTLEVFYSSINLKKNQQKENTKSNCMSARKSQFILNQEKLAFRIFPN